MKNIIMGGKYRILEELGKGGMSVVYLAEDFTIKKKWAVKKTDKIKFSEKHDRNLLYAEARLMKKFDHEALPSVIDIFEDSRFIYIVMDYIPGISLESHLKLYGPQPEETVLIWAGQLCRALIWLHSQRPPIIYRDMKPSNIILKPDGKIKIIDFGIAKEYRRFEKDKSVFGTSGYSPPEQYFAKTDQRSDIYALGMTLRYLLTAQNPSNRISYMPIRAYKSEISKETEYIVEKCIRPDPKHRYRDAEELLSDIENPAFAAVRLKKRLAKKVRIFFMSAVLSFSTLICALICTRLVRIENEKNYYAGLNIPSAADFEERIDGCLNSVKMYPEKVRSYIRLLEVFEEEGLFTDVESALFLSAFSANRHLFDTSDNDTAELLYKAGLMYLNRYSDSDGNYVFSTRIQKAYSFFDSVFEGAYENFDKANLARYYCDICGFYRKYVFESAFSEEAGKEEYEELAGSMRMMVSEVYVGADSHNILMVCSSVILILYDLRTKLANVGADMDKILEVLDASFAAACSQKPGRAESELLKNEIEKKYEEYRIAVIRSYEGKQ